MTAPDDLIRRDTAERAIRSRQRDTEDSGIYAGLSVALQELAALPADPVAEAAGKLVSLAIEALRCTDAHAEAWEAYETKRRAHDYYQDDPEFECDLDDRTKHWPETAILLRAGEASRSAREARDAALRAAVAARAKETR